MSRTFAGYFSAACILIVVASAAPSRSPSAGDKAWAILEYEVHQSNVENRVTAVRVLGLLSGDHRAIELAEKMLQDPKPEVRAAAATALGQMDATAAIPNLKRALSDKDMKVVLAAAHSLRLMHDPAGFDVYYEILTGERKSSGNFFDQETQMFHDPRELAKIGFEQGIGYIPYAGMGWDAFETIRKNLNDGTPAKAAAATNLATDPDPHSAVALVNAAHDKNWVIRVAALEAIAKRGDSSLTAKVEDCLSDPKPEVQDTAAAVIVHLSEVAEVKKDAAVK